MKSLKSYEKSGVQLCTCTWKTSWEDVIRITWGQRLTATLLLLGKYHPRSWGSGLPALRHLHKTPGASPLLSNKGDVELVSLELFPGIGHHLIEGSLQQVIPTNNEPEKEKGWWARPWSQDVDCVPRALRVPGFRVSFPSLPNREERGRGRFCQFSKGLS